MTIKPGDRLPEATFKVMTENGPADTTTSQVFAGKRAVLFAVPGAFTPTCHTSHLPGFLANADTFRAKGVDVIACTAVNDVFVLDAWAKASKAEGKILFLSDGNGDFARALGLEVDIRAAGLGLRSKRYAMVVDDGVVKSLHVEPQPGVAEVSGAANVLGQL